MSQSPPQIFDRTLLIKRQMRALRQYGTEADFLLRYVAEDLQERLSMVLRDFAIMVELGSPTGLVADILKKRRGTKQVIRIAQHAALLGGSTRGEWHGIVGDVEALPIGAQSAHCIVAPLSLHWLNDLPGCLFQIRNSLKPDGVFLASLLGRESLHELRSAFLQADSEISGGASPRVSPFPDLKDMGGLLQRAGFSLPVSDQDMVTVRYDSLFALMQDLRKMGATNCLFDRSKRFMPRATLLRAAEIYQEKFADPDGRVRASFQILSISGWAPHDSQQKPLRPGSATYALADILNDKSEREKGG